MKMGGNAFATEFFKKNGGSNLLTLQDGKQKYTSRVAGLYKEELESRIAEDERRYVCRASRTALGPRTRSPRADTAVALPSVRFGELIFVEGVTDTKSTAAASSSAAGAADDDFFNSFDSTPAPLKPAPAPVRPAAAPTAPKATSSSAPAAPRTTSSASLRTTTTAAAGAGAPRTINSAPKAMKLGGGSKLGARKARVAIDFEAAERKAKEEEARIAKLGYDRKKEEDERKAKEEEEKRVQASKIGASAGSARSYGSSSGGKPAASSAPPPPRLGFGQTFAAPAPKASPSASNGSSYAAAEERTYARDKFTSQKGAFDRAL
jgi:ADP-ribosylation factor GTPase-activating protein 2/3